MLTCCYSCCRLFSEHRTAICSGNTDFSTGNVPGCSWGCVSAIRTGLCWLILPTVAQGVCAFSPNLVNKSNLNTWVSQDWKRKHWHEAVSKAAQASSVLTFTSQFSAYQSTGISLSTSKGLCSSAAPQHVGAGKAQVRWAVGSVVLTKKRKKKLKQLKNLSKVRLCLDTFRKSLSQHSWDWSFAFEAA